ncbi:MAG: EpsG family protein [Clostridia bacterium]|nr:EpsG family protein [Clostridia bacterium]
MFLVERLIGVSIYSYILIMMCLLIAFTNIKCKNILRLYLLLLGGMGFFYLPYITADLYRTYDFMRWYATFSFPDFYETLVVTSSVPASRIYFWFIGKTGIVELLPFISAIISYSLIFYTLEKSRKRFSISRQNFAIALFFLMSGSIYISVIGGIRMMLALSMIFFCFYRETVEKKKNPILHIPLYIIAVFMHDMALIVLAIRILASVFDKRKSPAKKLFILLGIGVMFLAAIVLFRYKLESVFEKSTNYLTDSGYYDIWEYLMGGIYIIFFLFLVIKFKTIKKQYLELSSYYIAAGIGSLFAIICCYDFSIFYRCIGHVVPILIMPTLMIVLEKNGEKPTGRFKVVSIQCVVLLFSLILLFIGGTRGSLSALKFFEIG